MGATDRKFEVLIAGAGVAGLEAMLALDELASGRAKVTVLDPGSEFHYRPLAVREPFTGMAAARYPLESIVRRGGAELIRDSFKWLDPSGRVAHTEAGRALHYDAILLALGARAHPRFPVVLTVDSARLGEQLAPLVAELDAGALRSVAYVVPSLPIWPLPAYELALMTATRAAARGHEVEVTVITPEDAPLAALGARASEAVGRLLEQGGVRAIVGLRPQILTPHMIELHPSHGSVTADLVIALPELYAPAVPGVPTSAERGFITVDWHGAAHGLERVYAAGDITDSPVKHGGLAADQALVAAESIAALAGADVRQSEHFPLIGVMLIGGPKPLFITSRVLGGHGIDVEISDEPLWEPIGKLDAPHLAACLAAIDAGDRVSVAG
jgi:sulfide:quinone oxidoreductase